MFGIRRNPPTPSASEGQGKNEEPKRTRRRKEEPPRPWGKRERYGIFGILVFTVGAASILALSARSWKLPGLPRLALPANLLQETYVLEGKKPMRDTSVIISEFQNLTRDTSGVYGFYVINLNTDETYGVREDEVFQAASLIKLPVMFVMYAEHEKDNLDLDDTYTLKNEDKVGGSGSIYYKEPGAIYTYRELVAAMGQQSDNTAFNVSRNLLGDTLITEYITELGMASSSLEENETTPRDIGNYFKKLWSGKVIAKKHRDELLKSLTETIYESWIPAGIPGTRVAHKFGREVHVVNDAGIVFGAHPYVLVIMSKGVVEPEADELIPELARAVHNFETTN